jgi:hypothetical protein
VVTKIILAIYGALLAVYGTCAELLQQQDYIAAAPGIIYVFFNINFR